MSWILYQAGPHNADVPMATISADGKEVIEIATWKAELAVQYILNSPGEVEHKLAYLRRQGGRKKYSLAEFIRWRDGPAKGAPKTKMAGRVAAVRHQPPRAFGDETVAAARALMAEGLSLRKTAERLGVKPGTLSDRLKQQAA